MNPTRITVAFDSSTVDLLDKINNEAGLSQSEVIRRAVRFYYENRVMENPSIRKKIYAYMDLLLNGEHVILDVDHWLLFLKFVQNCPSVEDFWAEHQDVARSHREQLKTRVKTPEELLTRLETCNFFRVNKNSENDFSLILGSELPKTFVRIFLEEYFAGMGIKAEITENFVKLRVTIKR